MFKFRLLAGCTALAAISAASHAAQPRFAPDAFGGYPTTHILVRFDRGVQPVARLGTVRTGVPAIDWLAARWNVTAADPFAPFGFRDRALADRIGLSRTFLLRVPKGTNVIRMAREFHAAPGVEYAELDAIGGIAYTPNDPNIRNCWGLNNTGQTGGIADADIDAFEAWDTFTGGSNVILAVIDTGVDPNHPELAGKIVPGWNTNNNSPDTMDRFGHGTHVAGTAGAWGDNNVGFAGVSFGLRIMPMKCLTDGGSGTESQCGASMIWAADQGADLMNMSLQYYGGSTTFRDAVDYAFNKGVLLIAATGNNQGRRVAWPAKFDNCQGIGASTHTDAIAGFSNYGPEVDVAAPGENVYSCTPNNSYAYYSGTSMASPHTAGAAGLLWSFDRTLLNTEVFERIRSTAEDRGSSGFDERFGWGRINVQNAIAQVAQNRRVASSFAVQRGTLVSGNVNALGASDDQRLRVRAALPFLAGDPYLRVLVSANLPQAPTSSLRFVLESSSSLPATNRIVEFFNFEANAWEQVAASDGSTSDKWVVARVQNPARFVSSSLEVRARFSSSPLITLGADWTVDIDEMRWSSF
jgi:subtilisin family serine protease